MYKNKLPVLLNITVFVLLFSCVLVIYKAHQAVTIELKDAETKNSITGALIGVEPELDVIASPGTCGAGKFLYRPTSVWMSVRMTGTAPGYQKVVVNKVLLLGENYIIWLKKSNSFSQYKPCGII